MKVEGDLVVVHSCSLRSEMVHGCGWFSIGVGVSDRGKQHLLDMAITPEDISKLYLN